MNASKPQTPMTRSQQRRLLYDMGLLRKPSDSPAVAAAEEKRARKAAKLAGAAAATRDRYHPVLQRAQAAPVEF